MNSALSGKGGKFELDAKKADVIKFNYKFTRSQIEKLLADMSNGSLEAIDLNVDKVLEDLLKFTKGVVTNAKGIEAFLKGLNLSIALEYLQGSAIIFQGGITKKKNAGPKNQSRQQKFISAAQLTAILQRRLAQIMPRGPQKGPPLSPNIPNYRGNLIRFFYDPIYKTFINSPRNPDVFIANTLREIIRENFSRQFGIVRGA
jgi:hypothetical protein